MFRWLLACALAMTLVLAVPVSDAHAGLKMCAFRKGPKGPCTCQNDKDAPGQFTVVSRSHCKRAIPTARKQPEQPAAAPPVAEEAPQETAQTPAGDDVSNTPADSDTGQVAPPAETAEPEAATAPEAAQPAQEPAPVEASAPSSSKLAEVKSRGILNCGVNKGLLGFSAQTASGSWAGIDADFCRAIAAAVLGDGSKVEFIPLETNERFEALQSDKVDVLSRNTTWTMNREVDLGLRFAGVLYFDGQGFMVRDDRGLVSAQQLSGLKICVESGTTSETNMQYYFKSHQIDATVQSVPTHDEIFKAYEKGDCDVYSGDRSALYSDRASLPDPAQHTILPEVISKEPLGPLVLKSDDEWIQIVRWTLAALINAEEVGLDKASASASAPVSDDAQRLIDGAGTSGEKLHLSKTWLRDVVSSVGNYGEIFEANLGKTSPLGMNRGLNALWKRGGILYAPPMW